MRIDRKNALGLLIDMQERLVPHMWEAERLLERTSILLQGLNVLRIPLLTTEQYPRGLGSTIDRLSALGNVRDAVEKLTFSCCAEPAFMAKLEQAGLGQVIVCGIETHVCVLQTVIDLLEANYTPVVVADCVSSRSPDDKALAIERMRQEGALISSAESLLFELSGVAGTSEFKAISRLIK
ncbi:MAG: hydrolase [Bacteroidetes bacterium]|nr:MAG: hydrolase [Bacteroidota bacterium]